MRGLSENLQCKNPSFFTKWCDLLDLSYGRKLLDMLYIDPRGVRGGIALIFFEKMFLRNTLVNIPLSRYFYSALP